MPNINFKVGFSTDKNGINQLKQEINQINKLLEERGKESGFTKEIKEAIKSTQQLSQMLDKATDNKLDKLNTKVFNDELKKSNSTLSTFGAKLKDAGIDGSSAIRQLNREIKDTGVEVKQTSKLLDDMFDTFGNTVKWGIASSIMNQISGSISRAVGFTKALDESLNNIQVVSEKNSSEMRVFAREANEAAKALGKTTTEYTDASLIFFQQGKAADEVRSLTEATLMGANVTGTEVSEMADLLTAVMNGYNIEASRALEITDKLAAVGAATGSDFEELAIGMSKVASMANVAGVDIDRLNAMLATTVTVTREAPESIGTSFKTIFGRIAEVKAGAADEEGWDLGKVEETFQKAGLTVLDAQGKMKDVGVIIEEVGSKWSNFNRETQMALANAMAGQRQANRLIALFQNWGMYLDTVTESQESLGATMQQNETRMESMSYKSAQFRAELERLWMNLINSDFLKDSVDLMTGVLEKVNNLSESLGGIESILGIIGGVFVATFSRQIASTLQDTTNKLKNIKTELKNTFTKTSGATPEEKERAKEFKVKKGLSDEDFKIYKQEKQKLNDLKFEIDSNKELINLQNQRIELNKQYETLGKQIIKQEEASAEQRFELRKVAALKEANAWQQTMIKTSMDYEAILEEISEEELRVMGHTKESIAQFNSFEDVISHIKSLTMDEGLLEGTEEDIAELQRLDAELENIQKELAETEKVKQKTLERTQDLESQAIGQGSTVQAFERQGEASANIQKVVGAIGVASMALGTLVPAIKTVGDETVSTSDKMDAWGDGLIATSMSLMTMGGPVGLIAGGIGLLGGVVLKVAKNFQDYDQAVKKNEETIERYKRRTAELTNEISTLERQSRSLEEYQREIQLVGGDLAKLTVEQQEAYKALGNEIAETTPTMVAYYTAEGDAILKTNASLKEYQEQKKKALQLEKDLMVANKENFLIEYSQDVQLNEDRLKAEREKSERLKKELEDMKASGKSAKKISKKEKEVEASLVEIEKLQTSLESIDTNIQENIINPFMQSKEEIVGVNDAVKQVVASTYELDDVQKIMDKYKYKWEIINGEPVKTKRSYTEMAQKVKEELEGLEEKALNVASALRTIQKKTGEKGELGEEFRVLYNNIVRADQATQAYIGTVASFGMTEEGSIELIKNLANSIDEFGIAKPVELDAILPIATAESQKIIDNTTGRIKELTTQLGEAQAAADAVEVKETTSPDYDYSYSYNLAAQQTNEYKAKLEEVERLETQLGIAVEEQEEAIRRKNELMQNSVVKQQELNIEYEKYLMSIASTPEGLNKIIESYNAQYEKMQELNSLMTNSSTETQTISGEVNENGEIGEPIQVEVERFEDSELGNYFFEFESKIAEIKDELLPSLGDGFKSIFDRMKDTGEGLTEEYEKMAEAIKSIPDSALEGVEGVNKDLVKAAKEGSRDAIDAVVSSVNKQQQALGRMYAVINKDSTSYFVDFKKQNQEQMRMVSIATGVMGDDYATYAEYTAALDAWMAENSSWLSNEKVANEYWAAVEGINAAAEQGYAYDEISGSMVQVADADGQARANAVKAASYASIVAEAEASKERAALMQASLRNIDTSGIDPKLADAAQKVLQERAAEAEADLAMYDAIIKEAQAKMAALGGGATTTSTGSYGGGGRTSSGGSGLGNFNYSVGGGNVAPRPTAPSRPATGTSGPSVNTGGGGGDKDSGSSKDDSEKEVEDLEWEEDLYHDINILLEQKSQLLETLKKQQDKLYGKELLDNLAKQKKVLQEQQKLYEQKLEMQKKDLSNQRSILSGKGVQFNVDGTIANYNTLLKQKLAYVNSLSGEAKEAAKEEFEELTSMMEEYEELLMSGIYETQNAIQDAIDAQREIFLQEFEYTITLRLNMAEDVEKALDFMKEMNDEFEDYSDNFERTKGQIENQIKLIKSLKNQLEKVNNDPSLTEKERLEMLEKYNEELQNSVKELKELDEELTKLFEDTLKDGLDIIKEHSEDFKDLNKQLSHFEQSLSLIGEGDNFGVLDSIYETQYKSLTSQIGIMNSQMDALKAQKDALESAEMKGTEEWKAIDDAIKSTQESINSLAQESLKLLQKEFQNSINSILSDLDKALSGGSGLDEIKKQHQEIKDERSKYLDGEEKLLAVSKLQQKVQKEIDETSDPKRKAELQKFMDSELKALKEKDKLTKYDVDRANKIYDITLKQMALDEQRATKNIMRLVRDTQGNWVYEFTEDAKAIEKAQEDVSSAMEELMELDKKKLEETQDLMMKLQEEYYKEVQQLAKDAADGKFATEEEMRQKLQEITDKYNQKMVEANATYEQVKQNATISSMAVIVDTYDKTGDILENLTVEQEILLQALADKTGNSFLTMSGVVQQLISGDDNSIVSAMKYLGLITDTEMEATGNKVDSTMTGVAGSVNNTLNGLAGSVGSTMNGLGNTTQITLEGVKNAVSGLVSNMQSDWGLKITDMISNMVGSGGFKEQTNSAVTSIMDKWNEYKNKVNEVQNSTGLSLDNIINKIGETDKATEELNKETNNLINKFKEEMNAITSLSTAYQKNRDEIKQNINATIDYINKINQAIEAIKKKNDIEANPPKQPTPAPTPTPSKPKPSTPSGPQGNGKIDKGDRVTVKSANASAWYTAYGTEVLPWSKQAAAVGKAWNDNFYVYNEANGRVALSKAAGEMALAWVNKSDIQGFDTGGYTGDWNSSNGKLAMLHEKELVLNKEDTSKILNAVQLVRGLSSSTIDGIAGVIIETSKRTIQALDTIARAISPNINGDYSNANGQSISQNITIEADFSGVKTASEIEKAFENMANIASQYVGRK